MQNESADPFGRLAIIFKKLQELSENGVNHHHYLICAFPTMKKIV